MIRSKRTHDRLIPIGALCALYAAACGSNGGSKCTVTDQHDGTYKLSCDGQDAVTLQGAPNAQDAGTCSVEQNDGGGATIRCPDGTEATIPAAEAGATGTAGTSCTVKTVDGGASVSCDDGTKATITDGAGCDVKQEVSGDFTVTCGQDQVVLPGPGSDASCHVTYVDGAAMLNCDDGSSVAIGRRQLPTLIMGGSVACALAIDGEVVCWGNGSDTASPLAGGRYVRLIGNRNGSTFCAMDAVGDVDCWGRNDSGQTVVPNETFRTAEWLGTHSLCGITLDDRVVCWPYTPSPAILKADDD